MRTFFFGYFGGLFQFFPDLNDPPPLRGNSRKEEVVLCRLHIGHTYFTHGCVLKDEDPPWCHACDCLCSVRHFLIECVDLSLQREQYFTCDSLLALFKEVSLDKIFNFLKNVNLYHLI